MKDATINYKTLLKALRETPLTAVQITERSGCASQSVYNACSKPEKIRVGTVLALCAAMGISTSGIISGKVDPEYAKKHFLSMRLGLLQKNFRFSTKEISELSGVATGMLSDYMSGKRLPSETTLTKIAKAFGVNPAWLVGDVDIADEKKQVVQTSAISHINKWLEIKGINASRLAVEANIDISAFTTAFAKNDITWAQINALSREMNCSPTWLAGLSYVGAFSGFPAGLKCKFSNSEKKISAGKPAKETPAKKSLASEEKASKPKEEPETPDEAPVQPPEEDSEDISKEIRPLKICANRDSEGHCSVGKRIVSESECEGCPFYQEASVEMRVKVLEARCVYLEDRIKNLEKVLETLSKKNNN